MTNCNNILHVSSSELLKDGIVDNVFDWLCIKLWKEYFYCYFYF
jgi:hypothetical protein